MSSPEPTDHSLLREFCEHGSAAAFRCLADRYAGLVFSTALRRTGQRPLAEEVAQNVFAVLARKATALSRPEVRLAAWLHRATVLEASQACRREARRQRVMKDYTHHVETQSAEDAARWRTVLPELDSALDALPSRDRELLIARFFEDRPYRDIAMASGRTEAALMQQQHRALERLAATFRRRGIAVPAAALAAGLGSTLTEAAPAGLATSLAASAPAAAGTLTAGRLFWHSIEIFMQTKSRLALVSAAAVCLLGGTGAFLDGKSDAFAEATARLHMTSAAPVTPSRAIIPPTGPRSGSPGARTAPAPEDLRTRLDRIVAAWRAAPDRRERMIAIDLLDRLPVSEVPDALEYLESLRSEYGLFLDLGKRIAVLWGAAQPAPSLQWLTATLPREHRGEPMQAMLTAWAAREPEAAVKWWQNVVDSLDFPIAEDAFERFEPVLYTGWASKDPAGLIASLTSSSGWENDGIGPESPVHAKVLGLATAAANPTSRTAVLDSIRAVEAEPARASLAMHATLALSTSDPEAARGWVTSLKFQDPTHRNHLLGETAMIHTVMQAMAPAEAVAWLRRHTDAATVTETIDRFARENDDPDRTELIDELRTAAAQPNHQQP